HQAASGKGAACPRLRRASPAARGVPRTPSTWRSKLGDDAGHQSCSRAILVRNTSFSLTEPLNQPARSIEAAVPLSDPAGATPTAAQALEGDVAGATSAERRALRVLQLGAIFVVLAAVTWKTYELDRFFIPKEFVLHLTAFAGLIHLRRNVQAPRM